jgi:hypothetical protein
MTRTLVSFGPPLLTLLLAALPLASPRAQVPAENQADYLPPGAGKELVETRCGVCHDLRPIVALRKSRGAWDSVVSAMVSEGASLSPDEVDVVVTYLGDVLGPQAPPLTDVNAADRDALMKVPGITAALADRLIAHRTTKGPLASRDEVRAIVGLDEAGFDKIKWYLRAVAVAR